MEVFISWSGPNSKSVGRVLHKYLPMIIQPLKPWMSDSDIDAGTRWLSKINENLDSSPIGILCVSKENTEAPWLLFEAGARASRAGQPRVIPYLFELTPTDLPAGPLTQFNAVPTSKKGTFDLLVSLNKSLGTDQLPPDQLKTLFNKFWPDIDAELKEIETTEESADKDARTDREILIEILKTTRSLSRPLHQIGALTAYPEKTYLDDISGSQGYMSRALGTYDPNAIFANPGDPNLISLSKEEILRQARILGETPPNQKDQKKKSSKNSSDN